MPRPVLDSPFRERDGSSSQRLHTSGAAFMHSPQVTRGPRQLPRTTHLELDGRSEVSLVSSVTRDAPEFPRCNLSATLPWPEVRRGPIPERSAPPRPHPRDQTDWLTKRSPASPTRRRVPGVPALRLAIELRVAMLATLGPANDERHSMTRWRHHGTREPFGRRGNRPPVAGTVHLGTDTVDP